MFESRFSVFVRFRYSSIITVTPRLLDVELGVRWRSLQGALCG
jgi:hypothetical protein